MVLLFLLLTAYEHIDNPKAPTQGKAVRLVKELSLGGGEVGDEQLFSGGASLAATAKGTVYVLDSGNFRIQIFERTGKFQKSFGQQGPGPGEFSEPVAIALNDEGQVMIFDTGTHKMALFDAEGTYIREQRIGNDIHGLYQPVSLPGGLLAITCYKLDQNLQMGYHQLIMDKNMKEVKRLRTLTVPKLNWDQAENPAFWVDFLAYQLKAVAQGWPLQARAGQRLVAMHTAEYEGSLHRPAKEGSSTFSKKYKPRPLSEAGKQALCEPMWQSMAANPAISDHMGMQVFKKALARVDSLQRMPPVNGLATLGDGFAVLADYQAQKRTGIVDIFDRKGKLIAQASYTGVNGTFTGAGQYLYTVGPDEDDNVVVEGYLVEGL